MAREKQTSNQLIAWLRKLPLPCYVEKTTGTSMAKAGRPDVLLIVEGRAYWFEVKLYGAKPTERQLSVHRELARGESPVFVVYGVAHARAILLMLDVINESEAAEADVVCPRIAKRELFEVERSEVEMLREQRTWYGHPGVLNWWLVHQGGESAARRQSQTAT